MTSPPGVRHTRSVAILLLVLLGISATLVLSRSASQRGLHSLQGQWPAQILTDDGVERRPLPLPSLFESANIPADAIVTWTVPVDLPPNVPHPVVLIERPRYAAAIDWDGQRLAQEGDIPWTSHSDDGNHLLMAEIPQTQATPGPHELAITVQGAMGEGGLVGRVLWGERDAVWAYRLRRQFQSSALTAAMALAGIVGLLTAAQRGSRRDFLVFALFATAMSAFALTISESWWMFSDSVEWRMRVRRGALSIAAGSGITFLSLFAGYTHRTFVNTFATVTFLGFLAAVAWPDPAITVWVNHLVDATVPVTAIAMPVLLWESVRQRRTGALALTFAAILFLVAVGMDVAITRGWSTGSPLLLPAMIIFAGTAVAGVVIRFSDDADRFRHLFHQARDGIAVVQRNGAVTEANEAARSLGLVTGRPLEEAVDATDRPAAREHLRDGGNGSASEWRTANTRQHVESVVVDLAEGRRMLVLRDITRRRELEAGLLRAARVETVATLAGGLAHDVNNALAGLSAHLGILENRVPSSEQLRIERMSAIIQGASHLTGRLLALVRSGPAPASTIDPTPPITQTLALVQSMLPDTITVDLHMTPGLPMVLVGPGDLEQVLLNLLINARDAMALTGGTIHLEVRPDAGDLLITVQDEGPGVPEDLRDHIWEPFFTTKGVGRGTGLGLSVVQRVVDSLGGDVSASNAPTRGARFQVRLPRAAQTTAEPSDAPTICLAIAEAPRRSLAFSLLSDLDLNVWEPASSGPARRSCDILVTDSAQAIERCEGHPTVVFMGSSAQQGWISTPLDPTTAEVRLAIRKALLLHASR